MGALSLLSGVVPFGTLSEELYGMNRDERLELVYGALGLFESLEGLEALEACTALVGFCTDLSLSLDSVTVRERFAPVGMVLRLPSHLDRFAVREAFYRFVENVPNVRFELNWAQEAELFLSNGSVLVVKFVW
jgi:hypothetical protein